jgi:hypothetical protein
LAFIRAEPWQRMQTWAESLGLALFRLWIWCSEWQSVQLGASRTPAAMAWPWMLPRTSSTTSGWHWPQVAKRLSRFTGDSGALTLMMSWTPWQSEHWAAPVLPPLRAMPCTLAS